MPVSHKDREVYHLTISRAQWRWIEQLAAQYHLTIRAAEEYSMRFGLLHQGSLLDLYRQIKGRQLITMRLDRRATRLFLPEDLREWVQAMRTATACQSDSKMVELCLLYARLNVHEFCTYIDLQQP